MSAYYNEFDPKAASWLRELIKRGAIAPGEVDERSIKDVSAADLVGFRQCHFFAGIGVWSYALRAAGWPDDREAWTGSCPCQPFSVAGRGEGFSDERHLWPDFFRLIRECNPDAIFGEQVASKDGLAWLDLVYADLEGAGYAVGATDTCAAGFGAPHIRQRLYWVAHAYHASEHTLLRGGQDHTTQDLWRGPAVRLARQVAHSERTRLEGHGRDGNEGHEPGRVGEGSNGSAAEEGAAGGVAHTQRDDGRPEQPERRSQGRATDGRDHTGVCGDGSASPTNGLWPRF